MNAAQKNEVIHFVETELPESIGIITNSKSAPIQRYTEDNGPNCFMPAVYVTTDDVNQLVIDNPVRIATGKFEDTRA